MELNKDWLEGLLKRDTEERRVARVLEASEEPAVGQGENYCSVMSRINLKVILGSGVTANRSLLIKQKPPPKKLGSFLDNTSHFSTEIELYGTIFPEMERIMEEYNDTGDSLWCNCYGFKRNDMLVLEDLKLKGFRSMERKTGQDLNHAHLVISGLGRFHALATVLEKQGRANYKHLKDNPFCNLGEPFRNFLNNSFKGLAEVIKSTWDPKWNHVALKLEKMACNIEAKLQEVAQIDETKFNVLNHGDCWSNNMLFKYCPYTGNAIAVKFVDYQISHYNSYVWDLSYYLYTSVRPEVRSGHYSELLGVYVEALNSTLAKYGLEGDRAPKSVEEVEQEMRRMTFAQIVFACSILPLTSIEPDQTKELSNLFEPKDAASKARAMLLNKIFTSAIQETFTYFLDLNIFPE